MIKLPKEVARIMKTLTDAKQEAFAVGDCVRDALLGQKPIGWDIATDAGFDKLRELFPEAKVLSETYSILRMEFIEERYDDEGKFAGEDGIIIDVASARRVCRQIRQGRLQCSSAIRSRMTWHAERLRSMRSRIIRISWSIRTTDGRTSRKNSFVPRDRQKRFSARTQSR